MAPPRCWHASYPCQCRNFTVPPLPGVGDFLENDVLEIKLRSKFCKMCLHGFKDFSQSFLPVFTNFQSLRRKIKVLPPQENFRKFFSVFLKKKSTNISPAKFFLQKNYPVNPPCIDATFLSFTQIFIKTRPCRLHLLIKVLSFDTPLPLSIPCLPHQQQRGEVEEC